MRIKGQRFSSTLTILVSVLSTTFSCSEDPRVCKERLFFFFPVDLGGRDKIFFLLILIFFLFVFHGHFVNLFFPMYERL